MPYHLAIAHHHLDTNHHVNNGQYVRMAQDYIPEDFSIHQMRAEYKKQAVLGDVIVPEVSYDQGKWIVSLCDEKKNPYAIIEFE